MSLTLLLEKHILKDDIQNVNRGLGIRVSGTKDELIKALLAETDRSPKGTLRLFSKPVLQDACRKMGISRSGNKEEIIARLVAAEQRPASNPKASKPAPKKANQPQPKKEEAEKEIEDAGTVPKIRLIPKGLKKTVKPRT